MELLHNGDYLGNTGLSVVRPHDTTTNFLRRGFTAGITDRQTLGRKLLETTLQLSRRRESDLAKGTQPLEVAPQIWSGNYFQDRREHIERVHGAQTVAWNIETGHMTHRIKAGGEFDWVDSTLQLDRRPYTFAGRPGQHPPGGHVQRPELDRYKEPGIRRVCAGSDRIQQQVSKRNRLDDTTGNA